MSLVPGLRLFVPWMRSKWHNITGKDCPHEEFNEQDNSERRPPNGK